MSPETPAVATDPNAAAQPDPFADAFQEFSDANDAKGEASGDDADDTGDAPAADTVPEPAPAKAPEPVPPATTAPPVPSAPPAAPASGKAATEAWKPISESDPIWANASPEQKAAYREVAQRFRSDEGRQRAYQNLVHHRDNEIARLNNELKARLAAPAPSAPAVAGEAPALMKGADWQKLKSDYPEIAGPLQGVVATLLAENERLTKQVTQTADTVTRSKTEIELDRNYTRLTEIHPDWEQITASPTWINWIASQPNSVQQEYRRNGNGIVDVTEAANLFTNYKHHLAATAPPPTSTPAPAPAPRTNTAAHRERQLASSRSVSVKGPAPATGAPDDFDNAFSHFATKEERQRAAANG